ncbi:MAG: alpha,alpha-trehalase TreF [Candidatus Saccharimonadales bacterium]
MPDLPGKEKLKTAVVHATTFRPTSKSPDISLGELFREVQERRIYGDGKTFPDLIPRTRISKIRKAYALSRHDEQFDLADFVSRHFYEFQPDDDTLYKTDTGITVSEQITRLWQVLEKRNRRDRGSLLALPNPYVVPGGRFKEQFYWDTYFIMLGLAEEGKWDLIEGMIKNYAYMIRKFGFIPTANRTYFLSRSQPPFFSHMVQLLARNRGKKVLVEYLPYLLLEYRFWIKGNNKLSKTEHRAYARVVEMPNGIQMARYYDNKTTPRPESLLEDTETAKKNGDRQPDRLYLHLRAAAESGWDFSSRWFDDPKDISTIHTADIIPVDLNCLLYHLESTIAEAYRLVRQGRLANRFQAAADRRAKALNTYCWNEESGFYEDFNFHKGEQTGRLTLAGVFPLFMKIANTHQAKKVAEKVGMEFLKQGGLVTTLDNTREQWDSPNGWAPLQYITIQGLRNYGHYTLAKEVRNRWVSTNLKVFHDKHKLVEKYDVVNPGHLGGGGEYPLQDGFGWTNGVLEVLLSE